MAKVPDSYYFNSFVACADDACQAAHLLEAVMEDFHPAEIQQKLDEMHTIEHGADTKMHELQNVLIKAFITPIEQDDIVTLSNNIDDVIDKIEDVLQRIYCNNIQSIRPDALVMANKVIECCEEVRLLVQDLADFKRSKTLRDHVIRINDLEEQGDRLFLASMRALHESSADPIEIIAWREVYYYLECCMDACENVADTVERVVMNKT